MSSRNKDFIHSAHWGSFIAEVRDDRLVGVRPFHADPAPAPLIASMPNAVHAASRIDRPYVRRGWLHGDRKGGAYRGGEPFVPVDWDTATRIVADELGRVRDQYGPAAIFGGSNGWSSAGRFHHAKSQLQRMLGAIGGYTGGLTNYSYGAGMTLMPHLVGNNEPIEGPVADWRAIGQHAKQMLCFGGIAIQNGQIIAGGGGRHETRMWLREAGKSGLRFIHVSPMRGETIEGLSTKWIPIRPNTDAALMLAMAHVLIDDNLIDRKFLNRCTVGFKRLRQEVIGRDRSPVWAERITGIPAATIVRLARSCAQLPTMLTANWSLQRAEYGEQPYFALVALAALLGQIGQPGLGFSFGHGSMGGMGAPRFRIRPVELPPITNPANSYIPVARIADMLENPGQPYDYNGQSSTYPHIRLIQWAGGNPFHHHQDLNRFLRAWSRVETIVAHEPWWTPLARHADIVLPATTTLERNDIASSSRDRFIIAMKQAIPPQGKARNDFDILADIAEHLGARDAFTEKRDERQWLTLLYENCRAAAVKSQIALPSFEEFWERGEVEIPMPDEMFVPFDDFVRNPALHRLNTPSGKIELFSQTIASFGYPDCPGHPTWIEPREYLAATLAERYPLHLLSAAPATRLHGQLDQSDLSQASKIKGREPITMHADDAAARGLTEGDVVRVFNDRGACLAGLRTRVDMLRGVVLLATGAWFDPLVPGSPGSLCVHGNPNVLTNDVGTSRLGQCSSAQSCLVEIELWKGELPPIKVHAPPPIADEAPPQVGGEIPRSP